MVVVEHVRRPCSAMTRAERLSWTMPRLDRISRRRGGRGSGGSCPSGCARRSCSPPARCWPARSASCSSAGDRAVVTRTWAGHRKASWCSRRHVANVAGSRRRCHGPWAARRTRRACRARRSSGTPRRRRRAASRASARPRPSRTRLVAQLAPRASPRMRTRSAGASDSGPLRRSARPPRSPSTRACEATAAMSAGSTIARCTPRTARARVARPQLVRPLQGVGHEAVRPQERPLQAGRLDGGLGLRVERATALSRSAPSSELDEQRRAADAGVAPASAGRPCRCSR